MKKDEDVMAIDEEEKNGRTISYQPDDSMNLDVRFEDGTVWLTQAQMVTLFERERTVISKHIRNIFAEGELDEESNVHFLHIPNSDKPVKAYSSDVINSVGRRVRSHRVASFREWAEAAVKDAIRPHFEEKRGEIEFYRLDDSSKLEVMVENGTVWLNRQHMSFLFGRDVKTIGKHINNALNEELSGLSVVANFATTASDGKTYQTEYYGLDVILSVGYRVKSNRGVQFRIWSNRVLKDYVLKGYAINQRFEQIERSTGENKEEIVHIKGRLTETEKKIDFFVRTSLPPVHGIFYEGQIFDAHVFVSDLIRSAKRSVVLLDNYVDDTVLMLLSKRSSGVSAEIYTRKIAPPLRSDLEKHNAQYDPVDIQISDKFHDRFLIVDDTVYHIGASLKDLGKKLFAFFKMEIKGKELLGNIK